MVVSIDLELAADLSSGAGVGIATLVVLVEIGSLANGSSDTDVSFDVDGSSGANGSSDAAGLEDAAVFAACPPALAPWTSAFFIGAFVGLFGADDIFAVATVDTADIAD